MKKLEDEAAEGNNLAVRLCRAVLDEHGPGASYRCVVGSVASALLFHLYRIGKETGKPVELLQAVLDDVTGNLSKGGDHVRFRIDRNSGS